MKEITRIHIAKIPYDIEVAAKKELEKYINNLEAYANDQELLQDIEIRITELLGERGVTKDGVISLDDVVAIQAQLGEPVEFSTDAATTEPVIVDGSGRTRKLYRNVDSAVFGGVLAGIASFFRINSLWVRLIFIMLIFITSGAILLVYAILWIAVPPARTAAEKLQMSGRPVTLASIRELNASETGVVVEQRLRARATRRALLIIAGLVSAVAALGTFIATAIVAVSIFRIGEVNGWHSIAHDVGSATDDTSLGVYIAAYVLAIISGLLLTTLFAIVAYVAFSHKLSKRIVVASIVVIVLGLGSFGTAIGLVGYQNWQGSMQLQRDMKESYVNLPANFDKIQSLNIDVVPGTQVDYIVDSQPRVIMMALPGPQPVISMDGQTATITLDKSAKRGGFFPQATLTIYGPKLTTLTATNSTVNYSTTTQDLTVNASGDASVSIASGTIGTLTINSSDNASVETGQSTVKKVIATMNAGATIDLGNIAELTVTQPTACPSSTVSQLEVQHISAQTMTYNGQTMPAKTHKTTCGVVLVGQDDIDNYQPINY